MFLHARLSENGIAMCTAPLKAEYIWMNSSLGRNREKGRLIVPMISFEPEIIQKAIQRTGKTKLRASSIESNDRHSERTAHS